MGDYKLSVALSGHDADVRAVCFPKQSWVFSASRDHTVRLWKRNCPHPPEWPESDIVSRGQDFINSLAYLPPSSGYPDGLVISGGKDTIIEVKKPNAQADDNAERLLIGHQHNVCSLEISPNGEYIVSGGWDGQARVWSVAKWETEFMLDGHGGKSVWGVLFLNDHTVVTGCADEKIRVFDLRLASQGQVQAKSTIFTTDIVRAVCKVSEASVTGADIASAHNDGVIRLWKVDGQQVGEMHGHGSFVYSLATLPSGELVSSGEDRTVRIWRGQECIQTITHPAISVWSVAASPDTGDIVTGASDGVVRVFTKDPERVAPEYEMAQWEKSLEASAIPQQQMATINKEKLPGPDFLKTRSGTKEGQVQMIKEENGAVTAHTWSTASQQWINVGTVVDAVGSSGKKVEYAGGAYDFVFDVDIEDGKPPLKLPYNLSENPYDRATKFLGDNELPLTYLDSVANFIVENTKGATIGESDEPIIDPYGTGRYQPGEDSAPQPTRPGILPLQDYIGLLQAKFDPILKKIMSINATMISAGRKDFALNPNEQSTLQQITVSLASVISNMPPSVSATSPSPSPSPFSIPDYAFVLVLKLVSQWSGTDRLPGLDLLRCMAPSPALAALEIPDHGTAIDIALSAAFDVEDSDINENCVMMAFRTIANIFYTEAGRTLAARKAEKVVSYMEGVVGIDDSLVKGPVGQTNRNLLIALSTAAINYAVLAYTAAKGNTVGEPVSPEVLGLIGNVMGRVLQDQTDSEVLYRALSALGTMAAIGGECKEAVKLLGAESWVKSIMAAANEERVSGISKETIALLR